jgi:hypothetical protein
MVESTVDFLASRDEVIDYLRKHSHRRQEIIADLVGMRRESLYAYTTHGVGLTHVEDLQKLHDFIRIDKANQQQITPQQMVWLLRNAQKHLQEAEKLPPRKAHRAIAKWSAKLRKYRKMAQKMGKE